MSLYSDWDVAYGLTYEALNRKLARVFYQQRSEKHKVKQLVARVIDPQHKGLTGGFSIHVVAGGQYDPSLPPTLEVSYFNEQLQQEQSAAPTVQYAPQLGAGGALVGLTQTGTQLPGTLFYPPGIEVRRNPGDTNTAAAVVLTGLQVGTGSLAGLGTVQATLADWLARPQGILNVLHRYLNRRSGEQADVALPATTLAAAKDYVNGLSGTTTLAECCGSLLEWLLRNVWHQSSFWMSGYLRTLLAKDTADVPELQALYAYAERLRNQPTNEAIRTSTDRNVLLAAIALVYQPFFDSEIANIRYEAVFRAKEALFKKDFNFSTHTIAETLLAEAAPTLAQPVAQALLEAFACLVPTLMPDLAFGVSNLTPAPATAATAFVLRLGPWRFEADRSLPANGFRIAVPVLGGLYYEQAGGELQIINDRNLLTMPFQYRDVFFKSAYKNPGFQVPLFDARTPLQEPVSEIPNPRSVTGFASHSFSSLLATGDATAFFSNHPVPAPSDPSKHGYEFAYSYTSFLATINLLAGLPQFSTDNAATWSWAKVTEYRFVFLHLVNDANEVAGHLYILGSINPRGSFAMMPDLKGGELSQLLDGNDSFLFIARPHLVREVFLRNVPRLFQVGPASSQRDATPADFTVTNAGEIQNVVDVTIRYDRIKQLLSQAEQDILKSGLELADDAPFVVPAGGFTLGARNNQLHVAISTVRYQEVVTLSNLQLDFDYAFRKQNGVQRYTLLATQVPPTVTLNRTTTWSTIAQWSNYITIGGIVVGSGLWGIYNWRKGGELRQLVPAQAQATAPDRTLTRLLNSIPVMPADRGPLVELSDLSIRLQPDGGRFQVLNGLHNWVRRCCSKRRIWHPAEFFPQQLFRKYSKLVYDMLRISDFENAPVSIYQQQRLEAHGLTVAHAYSLELSRLHKQVITNSVYLDFKLTDWLCRDDGDQLVPQTSRQIWLRYRYDIDDISTLHPAAAVPDKFVTNELTAPPGEEQQVRNEEQFRANQQLLDELDLSTARNQAYARAMNQLIEQDFVREIQRVLLETTYLRHQQDRRYKTFLWSVGGNVVTTLSAPALLILQALWSSRQVASEAPIRNLLGNRFINVFLAQRLNAIEYPYEDHFSVNALTIDAAGLTVVMGALREETLLFHKDLPLQQFVSTYLNVRDLRGLTLSVDGLRDQNQQVSRVEFDISFAYEDAEAAGGYRPVGKPVPFSLRADKGTLSISPAALTLADFQPVEQANTLVVRRLKPDFQNGEVNALTVIFR